MNHLKDKVILITGAAMGLGFATAVEAAATGAKLALVDYNAEGLEKAKAQISEQFPAAEILTIVADTSSEEQVQNYVEQTINKFGAIDGFYNNAGIEGKQAPLADYDAEVFKKVIDINLLGVYYGIKHVLPHMQNKNYGRIVNVASVGGIRGVMNQTPYVASKHAVAGITKNTALEYAKFGIVTNAIAPGAILTPMVAGAFKQVNPSDPAAAEKEYAQANPTKRLGKPEEVAKVVCFLLSDVCSYVNGQVIAIDGGQSNSYGTV
ncbi:glucose 1-dehydrogenase [uncultured Mucilaginibacter sp.]|uniref:glucose 1-dehydrogenase n=1 Tax=uncultured Mucilaginibacter sp. TaxID=797541 RepID=UPI0025CED485|nr:glucose 1-dehydrogenase [uncultured Mucilaginibacter sp.]